MCLRLSYLVVLICAESDPTKPYRPSNLWLGTGELRISQISLIKLYKDSFKQIVPWQKRALKPCE